MTLYSAVLELEEWLLVSSSLSLPGTLAVAGVPCTIPSRLFPHYAVFHPIIPSLCQLRERAYLLCPKLCRHNSRIPSFTSRSDSTETTLHFALPALAVSACVYIRDLSDVGGRVGRDAPYRTVSRPGNETNIFALQGPLHPLRKYNDSQYRELQRSDDY